ncbi:MAG TPA: PAS domain S-box protein [Gemmatimonadaceae bacterium]|jgi:PAS domain S-box-containing protein|nr:PAS domain S-box protein [Gemmatimonadaceae bacterium]
MTNARLTPLRSLAIDSEEGMTDDQFRRIARGLSSIMWRTNGDGTRLLAPRWAEITGQSEQSLQNGGWLSTVHAYDRGAIADALLDSRIHGSRFEVDFRLRLRNGEHHWFRARGEPMRNDRSEPVGLIGIASNIDGQKGAEAALVENEARLRCIIDAARVGTIEHDLATGRIRCSELALRLLDLRTDANLTFETVVSRVHPDDRAAFARAAEVAIAPDGNGRIDIVFRSIHADGRTVWASARGTYLFEGEGASRHAVRFVGVAADLGGRVRDLEERARLSSIVSSSNDAIMATTPSGIVTHWNDAATRMYGFTADEMIGRSVFSLTPPELLDEAITRTSEVSCGTPVSGVVTERLTKAGARIKVSLTLSPIFDELRNVIGLSSIVRDITNELQLQAELAQAQKMEAIGLLAGGVAHDINNMLTAILAGIELACQSPTLDAEAREYFDEVRAGSLRGAALIRQLLIVARRHVIHPHACNLDDIVCEMEPMIRRLVGESVGLATSYEATRGVYVDSTQMNQVILNLAANARDAMPNGGRLTISTSDDPATRRVLLRVEDTGCGMTPEVRARLFEPFYTTKAPGVGTGLGLSTTYGIVTQSQGTIAVESEVGAGSVFTISLPSVELPAAGTDGRGVAGRRGCGEPCKSRGNETIVIVEDDRLVRDQIVRGLTRLGYDVLEASNGRDALTMMQHHHGAVQLVLSDIVMPEMNGIELAVYLQAMHSPIKVLLMSGYSDRAVRTQRGAMPCVELIAKPFELSELGAKIRAALDAPPHPNG